MRKIHVEVKHAGYLAQPVDALIVCFNPEQPDDFSYEEQGIREVAGDQFHEQLRAERRQRNVLDNNPIVAETTRPHEGCFQRVVFVPDNGQPIQHIVYAGLCAAETAGSTSVMLPLMRLGENPGEDAAIASFAQTIGGLASFTQQKFEKIERIIIPDDHMLLMEMSFTAQHGPSVH